MGRAMTDSEQRPGSNSLATVGIIVMLSSIGYSCDTRKKQDEQTKAIMEVQAKLIEQAGHRK